jgi:hypothetical protein
MNKLYATLIALDQVFNAFVNGHPDETFSAACYRKSLHGKKRWTILRTLIDRMFFWDKEIRRGITIRHCQLSWEAERDRKHLPKDYKKS